MPDCTFDNVATLRHPTFPLTFPSIDGRIGFRIRAEGVDLLFHAPGDAVPTVAADLRALADAIERATCLRVGAE